MINFDNAVDSNVAWLAMYSIFVRVTESHCLLRTYSISKKRPPYITPEIVCLSKDREFNHKKAMGALKGSPSAINYWSKAVDLRKTVNNLIKTAKRDCILTKFSEAANNPVKFWNAVAQLVPSKKTNTKTEEVFCPLTNEFCNGISAANVINKFFTGIGQDLNSRLPENLGTFHYWILSVLCHHYLQLI